MSFRVCVFCAMSTIYQDSVDDQDALGRAICQQRGWSLVSVLRVEGHSRRYDWLAELEEDCPEFRELRRLIQEDEIDLVLVRDLDRLWRRDTLRAQITWLCKKNDVQIYSVNQPMEPQPIELFKEQGESSSSRLLTAMLGIISEEENELRRTRTMTGVKKRVLPRDASGQLVPGRQRVTYPPYGYALPDEPGGVMQVVEEHAQWVRWVFEQFDRGETFAQIARGLNQRGVPSPSARRPRIMKDGKPRKPTRGVWYPKSIRDMLMNAHYAGLVTLTGEVNEGQHEALVDRDLWHRTTAAIEERIRKRSGSARFYHTWTKNPLVTLMRCGLCGGTMLRKDINRSRTLKDGTLRRYCHSYYYCSGHMQSPGANLCQRNTNKADQVDAHVIDVMVETLQALPAEIDAAMQHRDQQQALVETEIVHLEKMVAECDKRITRWNEQFEREFITGEELMEHRARISAEQVSAKNQIKALRLKAATVKQRMEQRRSLASQAEKLRDMSPRQLHSVAVALIDRIVLTQGEDPQIVFHALD